MRRRLRNFGKFFRKEITWVRFNPLNWWLWLGILVVITVGFGLVWYQLKVHTPLVKHATQHFVTIQPGTGVRGIASELKDQGVISDTFYFAVYTVIHGESGRLHSGVYLLSPAMSIAQVADAISGGQQAEVVLTIPEGDTQVKIAQLVQKAHIASAQAFLAACSAAGVGEGYLFPDTYYFLPNSDPAKVVTEMKQNFSEHYTAQLQAQIAAQGLSPADGVTMASLVEHEARTDADRRMVAGVFLNRLRKGMTLGSDVALQYALGGFTHVLTQADLASNSPYNLRSKKGLPPTPIGSPGLSSLEAVANPTPSNYLFFIAGSDGQLHYAATLQEHNANIAKYL